MTRSSRRLRPTADLGSALVVTLAAGGLLSLLVAVALGVAMRSIRIADAEEETHGALAAAEAGVDDYLFRLNATDAYFLYDAANPPPDANPAFTGFVSVPGGETDTSVEDVGMFVYEVDNGAVGDTGVVTVTSTGCAPGPCDWELYRAVRDGTATAAQRTAFAAAEDRQRYRIVSASLRQQSFLDYLYFTDYETSPPLAYPTADQSWVATNCSQHTWAGGGRPTAGRPTSPGDGCSVINWAQNDQLDGPFHTNDTFVVNGAARWLDAASNSDPETADGPGDGNPGYISVNGARPTFDNGLIYDDPLVMPPSNASIRFEADHISNPSAQGCLFTGPTSIVLNGDGTYTVTSPRTKRSGSGCGSWTSGVDPAQRLSLPANGVIFVQPVPTSSSDPNFSSTCGSGSGNRLGYPYSRDMNTYDCRAGDVFIEGELDGRLTVAAENNITITWHLEYAGRDDMLGLVANDLVQIYHPWYWGPNHSVTENAGPNHPTQTFEDARVDAAILSVNNSFLVQSWNRGYRNGGCGALGDLQITGAIAQVYRGPVGTGSAGAGACTGYDKAYEYDERLRFINPPHFIDPVEAAWVISRYAEQF